MCPSGMRLRAIAPALGPVLLFACASSPRSGCCSPDRPAPPSPAIVAPPSVVPSSPSSSPSAEVPLTCTTVCKRGTRCALTYRGFACVACAPGSLPVCKDDRFVAVCGDDGSLQTTTDCSAEGKQCKDGRCAARECTPNALHCFEGNVHRCNATGTDRTLVTTCQNVDAGVLTLDKGVCQVRRGVPGCHTDCSAPDATILALFNCSPCEPPKDNFCATEGKHGCEDRICREWPEGKRISGPWPAEGPCYRETDGLAVPGSDRPGACEGEGKIGARVVAYQTCSGGRAIAAARKEPCVR